MLAPYRRDSTAPARQVKSQRERDLEALSLARRKGLMLAQLDALAADDRLDPASSPVIEWFRDQVKAAAGDGRLDELAALLPEAGIRRRRRWQGTPAALAAGYDDGDDDPDDDEDQADEDRPPLATPASIAGQQWRTQPGRTTWAEAIAASGWRLSVTVGGCQIVTVSQLCGADTTNSIGPRHWVCGWHYAELTRTIHDLNRQRGIT